MKRAQAVYVLLVDNPDGIEGLCLVRTRFGEATAACTDLDQNPTADSTGKLAARVELYRDAARKAAREVNRTVRLVRFVVREEVEIFHPDGRRERPS